MTQTFSERAEAARTRLFSKYDALNKVWLEAERQLTQFHIPREVYYTYNEDAEQEIDFCLGLARHQGKWRIVHAIFFLADESCTEVPITECSVALRCKTAAFLDDLRDEVIKSIEEFDAEVDKAIRQLRTSIDLHTPIPF